MRPKGSSDLICDRRRRALELLDEGLSLNEVARQIGCHASSVMRWRNTRAEGEDVFQVQFSPGRPTKLGAEQKKMLSELLLRGAMANGYRTDLWTTQRVCEVIEKNFGVHYHRDHIGRLLKKMGWSYQKPERRAIERDEEEIERWKREEWPRVKKTWQGWARTSSS